MIFNLSDNDSVANQFMAELRSLDVQSDRLRFRRNLQRLGQVMAYEVSKYLHYASRDVVTPLGHSSTRLLTEQPVLFTIMRAGLPFFQGFLDYFDSSDCGFIGAYRCEDSDDVTIQLDYVASPRVEGRPVIVIDPMLATGRSVVRSVDAIIAKHGVPRHLYIAALVSVPEGINRVSDSIKIPHSVFTCALDERLDERFYIVPGLGDAGDLSFGQKL